MNGNNEWQTSNLQPNQFAQAQGYSNIILVTGLDEALFRTTVRGSDMVYFNQSADVFYRVKVDYDGKKYWKEIPFGVSPQNAPMESVSRGEFDALVERVNALSPNAGGNTNVT